MGTANPHRITLKKRGKNKRKCQKKMKLLLGKVKIPPVCYYTKQKFIAIQMLCMSHYYSYLLWVLLRPMHPPTCAFSFLAFEKPAHYNRGQIQTGDFGSHLSRSMWFLVHCTVTKNSIKEDVDGGGGKKQIALQFCPRYCLELKEVESDRKCAATD